MVATKVKIGKILNCLRCNHKWLPRQDEIVQCPKCKSAYWNVPKKDSSTSKVGGSGRNV